MRNTCPATCTSGSTDRIYNPGKGNGVIMMSFIIHLQRFCLILHVD